jgi:hypothetical protein
MSKPREPQALDRQMRRFREIDVVVFPLNKRASPLPWSLGTSIARHFRDANGLRYQK